MFISLFPIKVKATEPLGSSLFLWQLKWHQKKVRAHGWSYIALLPEKSWKFINLDRTIRKILCLLDYNKKTDALKSTVKRFKVDLESMSRTLYRN